MEETGWRRTDTCHLDTGSLALISSLSFSVGKSNIGQRDMSVCPWAIHVYRYASSLFPLILSVWYEASLREELFKVTPHSYADFHLALLLFSSLLKLDRDQSGNRWGTRPLCIWSGVNCLVNSVSGWNPVEADTTGFWTAIWIEMIFLKQCSVCPIWQLVTIDQSISCLSLKGD